MTTMMAMIDRARGRFLRPIHQRSKGSPHGRRAPSKAGIAHDGGGLRIRTASPLDMGRIVSMALSFHRNDSERKAIMGKPGSAFLYRVIGPIYVWQRFIAFKATVSDRLAGYVVLFPLGDTLEVWDLGVEPGFRGRGIGTALMDRAQELARSRYTYLTLKVSEENAVALALYRKFGFINPRTTPVTYTINHAYGGQPLGNGGARRKSITPVSRELIAQDQHRILSAIAAEHAQEGGGFPLAILRPEQAGRRSEGFRIGPSRRRTRRQNGYATVERGREGITISLGLEPESCAEATMVATLQSVLADYRDRHTNGPMTQIQVPQAQEICLQKALVRMGIGYRRETPMLRLYKLTASRIRHEISISSPAESPVDGGIRASKGSQTIS